MWHQQDLLAYRVEPLLRRGSRKPLRLPRNRGTAAARPHAYAPAAPPTPPRHTLEVRPAPCYLLRALSAFIVHPPARSGIWPLWGGTYNLSNFASLSSDGRRKRRLQKTTRYRPRLSAEASHCNGRS